jgi:tetratricopeptide (TPR) repeat protein
LKRFWIIIIISILSAFNVRAQSLKETLAFADTLYAENNYEAALRQYKRVLFFNETENENGYVHQRLADCYFAVRNLDKALFEYSIAYNLETNDSIKNEFTFKRVLIHTLMENYNDASMELLSMEDSLSDYFSKRRSFYTGIVDLQMDSATNAKIHFIKALNPSDSVSIKKVESLFAHYNPNRPNPTLAKILSIFVPGLGQLYIGDYKNAINSFILSGGLLTVFMVIAINYTVVDAFFGVMPYFQRYYFGGVKHAKSGALDKQEYNQKKILSQLYTVFENRIVSPN